MIPIKHTGSGSGRFVAPGLSGGVGGEVPPGHGVQRPAAQREVLPDVPGGHAEGGAGRHGGAAVGEAPGARRQDQGQRASRRVSDTRVDPYVP